MKSNKNLIFLHIPKNGGNTLHSILNRVYPKNKTFSIEVINNTKLNTDDFIQLPIEKRSQIKLLKGHMLFGLHKYLIGETKYITFLRKPEDRIVSFYNYVINRPHHRLYKFIKDNNYTLYDFVVNCNEGDVHNAQIRWISGIEKGTEDQMYQQALKNITSHFALVGLQEEFNKSLIALSSIYKWGIPYYTYQNKGEYKKENLLDAKTKKAIYQRNKGDVLLYNYFENQFKQQFRKKPINYLKLWQLSMVNKAIKYRTTARILRVLKNNLIK